MTISIRPPRATELSQITQLQATALATVRTPAELATELQGSHVLCRVLIDERTVIGFINAWVVTDTIELTEIAIEPSQRGKGYGRHLLRWLIDLGRDQMMTRILLEVRDSNLAARTLYESFGFKVNGLRAEYYKNGEAAVLYSLEISSDGSGT